MKLRRFELKNPDIEWDDLHKSLNRQKKIVIDGVEYYVTKLSFKMQSNDVFATFTECLI